MDWADKVGFVLAFIAFDLILMGVGSFLLGPQPFPNRLFLSFLCVCTSALLSIPFNVAIKTLAHRSVRWVFARRHCKP